jgi:hypothetical protein
MRPIEDLNGPWFFDYGQLRDRDSNALASFPIYPGGIGGPADLRNGQLCALLPEILGVLAGCLGRDAEIMKEKVEEILK